MSNNHEEKEVKLNDVEVSEIDGLNLEPKNKSIKAIFEHISASGFHGVNPINPMFEKFNEGHIDKFLDYSEKDEQREYKLDIIKYCVIILVFIVIVALIVFFAIFFGKENPELCEKIILALVSIIAGAFGGYGIGLHQGKK